MSSPLEGAGFRLRRAAAEDAEFLANLAANEEVSPFLAVMSPRDVDSFLDEIEAAEAAPHERGRFVIEAVGEDDAWRAGSVAFDVTNRRSRIAHLRGLAVHPDFRGGKVADEAARLFQRYLFDDLGLHRLEMEIYGFNERAMAHAERSGFIHEGVRRKAFWRDEQWVDGVRYGLVVEDLAGESPSPSPSDAAV